MVNKKILSAYGKAKVAQEEKVHRRVMRNIGNPLKVAEYLREHNMWRRSEGKYAWNPNLCINDDPPFSPTTVGKIIDAAADFLSMMKVEVKHGRTDR